MDGKQLRQRFLTYFEQQDHKVVRSSSLVPGDDPTLLFTNAGMNQFKDVFLGAEQRDYQRAASVQKCVRAGGKHNDLDNVGKTARHHTFFEMLGNFSFGNYFKSEAIRFAWEFITKELGIPREKLYVTVFTDDDEAFDLWHKQENVPADRISRFGEKDNFWQMGDVGPCGPCSEVFYDHGEAHGCGSPDCKVGCECDRYVEIWNLVFMQFNRDADGKLTPLPRPSIDTGMGLERLAAVMQGVNNNYDTDLFQNIIRDVAKLAGVNYGTVPESDTAMRVIADHMRATTFLIADGVVPSNEGRGYVLRRIMRRAIRYGKKLGLPAPSLYRFVDSVVNEMGEAYPELTASRDSIIKLVRIEEEQFLTTLEGGLRMLNQMIADSPDGLDAENAFKLYDTFGFPIDLVEDVCLEKGINVDRAGFEERLDAYRKEAKSRTRVHAVENLAEIYTSLHDKPETQFLGYDQTCDSATVLAIYRDGTPVEKLADGQNGHVLLDKTPFYAESGGQVDDTGELSWEGGKASVDGMLVPIQGRRLHAVRVSGNDLKPGMNVGVAVSDSRRMAIQRNHTATHLLHAALRQVLGDHVKQAGSLVDPDKLRFDFSHFNKVIEAELAKVENIVNTRILENREVSADIKSLDDAMAAGAMALFGEKYGEEVRVVQVPGFSLELCGGTHVNRTGDIGPFVITSERSAASGIRRIEARTGTAALAFLNSFRREHEDLKALLKTGDDDLNSILEKKLDEIRELRQELDKARISGGSSDRITRPLDGNVTLLVQDVPGMNPGLMREKADNLKDGKSRTIVFLFSVHEKGCNYLLSATGDMNGAFHCGNALKQVAQLFDGRGGGKPGMAQGGGNWTGKIQEKLDALTDMIGQALS